MASDSWNPAYVFSFAITDGEISRLFLSQFAEKIVEDTFLERIVDV